ncbi:MAG: hypothetical protein KF802_02510 [Bdellovibrionaceae bacterium]|nr:hypothetical protein [Pseudobdellovibrionaceae bacterium]
MQDYLNDPKIQELQAEIKIRLKDFLGKQERGSQISVIRVARRTGFDPFYVRQILAGKSVPFDDVCQVLQALNCPSVYVQDFMNKVKMFSDEFKRIHGIEQKMPNLLNESPRP